MEDQGMIEGSCLCGAVKFRLTAPPTMMGTCHCSRCRKAGASTMVFVKREALEWLQGRDRVALHTPPAPFKYGRCFCRDCGTGLGEILSEEARFPIAADALDDDPGLRNSFHEHVADKPAWREICDDAARSEAAPD